MPLTVPKSKPTVTDIEEGVHPGVCVGVYDLGTQDGGKFKPTERVLFLFELPDFENSEGWPLTVKTTFSQTLGDKGSLKPFLQKWRGRTFTDKELDNYSVKERLGQPGMIQIIHRHGEGPYKGSVYANMDGIMPLYKGVEPPTPRRRPTYFDFADGEARIPDDVPDYIKDMIMASPEWKALKDGAAAGGSPPAKKAAPREIVDLINRIGLGWPFTLDELNDKFDPDVLTTEDYNLLEKHGVPF